jgi:membrane-bound serine protease (ClpP class)
MKAKRTTCFERNKGLMDWWIRCLSSIHQSCHPLILFLSALLFAFSAAGNAPEQMPVSAKKPLIYQIPIEGQIEPALLYVVRRGVTEAKKEKASAVVFVMDTPGGGVKEAREIISLIGQIDAPVYTFVEKDAYSAGAIIALSTKHIYMAPGSVIGAATPLMMSPLGGVEQMPEAVEEKMTSAVAALVRAAAEQGGHDPQLGEAMVRRELGYTSGTNVLSKAGELLTLTASEAQGILSEGTVADVSAMLIAAGLPDAEIRTLEVTAAEKIARVIAAFAPILLMIGLGGIYLEIKTPGFGLPGILGTAALVLFFFGHHLAGLAGMEDAILFIIGFILLFIEVFITPGFGVLGISGIALILFSLLSAMTWSVPGNFPPVFDMHTLQIAIRNLAVGATGTVAVGFFAGKFLPKSRVIRPLVLAQSTSKAEGFTAAKDHSELLGKEGVAEMNLHPAGRALIGNDRINIITRGEFIEKGSAVRVVETHGAHIVVEKI